MSVLEADCPPDFEERGQQEQCPGHPGILWRAQARSLVQPLSRTGYNETTITPEVVEVSTASIRSTVFDVPAGDKISKK